MREILYKGFHPCKNETKTIILDGKKIKGLWITGDCIHKSYPNVMEDTWTDEWFIRPPDYIDAYHFDVISETICSITEINGVKLAVGDIVEVNASLDGKEKAYGEIAFGEFDTGNENFYTGFYIQWHGRYFTDWRKSIKWWMTNIRGFKIVGNKFENPELHTDKT